MRRSKEGGVASSVTAVLPRIILLDPEVVPLVLELETLPVMAGVPQFLAKQSLMAAVARLGILQVGLMHHL
jgi:hypothetical protein